VENRKKLKSKKTDMLRSNSKQSGESVESVLKKKRKATVGRICRKGRFQACYERVRGYGILIITSIHVSSITTGSGWQWLAVEHSLITRLRL